MVVSKIGLINIGGQLLGQVTRDRRKCGGLEAVDGAAGAQFGSFSGGDLDGGLSGVGGEGGRHVVEGGALEALVACGDVAVLGDEEHRGSRHEVVASHQFETIVEEDGKLDAGAFDESTSVLGGVEGDRPELAADLGVLHVDAVPVEIADLAGLAIECEEGEEEGAGLEAVGEGATTALDVCQVEIGSLCPGGQHSFSSYLPELAKVYTLADHYIRTREHAMRTKLVELSDAVRMISDGDEVVMSSGFTDSPMAMLREIARNDLKDLRVVGVVGGSINLDFLVGSGQAAVMDCCSIGFAPFRREAPNFDRYLKESRIYAMDNT